MKKALLLVVLLALPLSLPAQPTTAFTIETVAGMPGVGDLGPLQEALLFEPQGLALDESGNLFIADRSHHRVRRISRAGQITTVAGTGVSGASGDGGRAVDATLNRPSDVAVDNFGNLYIADTSNRRVRKMDLAGIITTVAGTGSFGSGGDGGLAVDAQLSDLEGVFLGATGNLYIADTSNHRVRRVATDGVITTVAGTGTSGFSGDGGAATNAQLNAPSGVVIGRPGTPQAGALFIADTRNHRVHMVKDGTITTFAGDGTRAFGGDGGSAVAAQLGIPRKLAFDQVGNLFVTHSIDSRVRRITLAGQIETVAGAGFGFGGDGGPAVDALMRGPDGIATGDDFGSFFVSDAGNHRVRKVERGTMNPVTGRRHDGGDGGPATEADLFMPYGLETDNQPNVYIADTLNHRVRKLTFVGPDALGTAAAPKAAPAGTISTVAGTGESGFSGDGSLGSLAQLNEPRDVAVDSFGNVYIADRLNHRIRRLAPDGTISTLAGSGNPGFGGDGGPASAAALNSPSAVAVDSEGNVFVADRSNHRIRKIDGSGTITTIAGTGAAGFSGDGGQGSNAQLNTPTGVAVDSAGHVFFADTLNRRVRMISPDGIITTVAGNGSGGGGGDGGPATEAEVEPWDVAVDGDGNLYIADSTFRIRKVRKPAAVALEGATKGLLAGAIATIAGTGLAGFGGDGGPATGADLNSPRGVTVDALGNVYFSDSLNNVVRILLPGDEEQPLISAEGVVDAAGFGPRLAPDSIATAFVLNGAEGDAVGTTSPLPTRLGGSILEITDSQGDTRASGLFGIFNDGRQINFHIDEDTALGPATITLTRFSGVSSTAPIVISRTGAGIFFADNFLGQQIALAQFLRISDGVARPLELVFDPGDLSLVPIDLGPPGDQVFLVLFGTGIRLAENVQATIGGDEVPVFSFAPAPGFFGLDQVNVGRIPRRFINDGTLEVQLIVDGQVTNVVEVRFE